MEMTKRLLNQHEVCEYVGMSHNSCRKYFDEAVVRIGNKSIRYDIWKINEILERRSNDRVSSLDVSSSLTR